MNTRYYKKYIEKLINADPVNITIRRTTTIDDGFGGKEETTVTLEPQTVTFYDRKAQREVVSDAGVTTAYYASNVIKLLATGDADIKEGDIFEHEGRTYKVGFIKAYMGVCKQAELEVIA